MLYQDVFLQSLSPEKRKLAPLTLHDFVPMHRPLVVRSRQFGEKHLMTKFTLIDALGVLGPDVHPQPRFVPKKASAVLTLPVPAALLLIVIGPDLREFTLQFLFRFLVDRR